MPAVLTKSYDVRNKRRFEICLDETIFNSVIEFHSMDPESHGIAIVDIPTRFSWSRRTSQKVVVQCFRFISAVIFFEVTHRITLLPRSMIVAAPFDLAVGVLFSCYAKNRE